MTAADIAAYVGAAAWLPQITTWLYKWLTNPVLTITTEPRAEIGFTSNGPIFNVRMAFSSERKDLIIDGFQLELVHQDGDKRVLRWSGIQENLGETRDPAGVTQGQLMKDQVPIALKIVTGSLLEKFVRFQEPHYSDMVKPLLRNLVTHFNYLKRTDPEYVATVLKSKELLALVDAREKHFWWKPGHYKVTLRPTSPKKFSIVSPHYSFDLLALDVDPLHQNIDSLKKDIENTINSNLPDFKATPVSWNWAYADFVKTP